MNIYVEIVSEGIAQTRAALAAVAPFANANPDNLEAQLFLAHLAERHTKATALLAEYTSNPPEVVAIA